MITMEEMQKKIKFTEDAEKIEEIKQGYSKAYKYKIEKKDKCYFLKILPNREHAVERIQEISQVYQKSEIAIANLVDCGIWEERDLYYCIYEWIEGITINRLINEKPSQYFYEIGKEVGKKLKFLKEVKQEAKFIMQTADLHTKVQTWLGLLENIPDEVVYRYFSKEEVEDIKQKMLENIKYFNEADRGFVHTDIRLGNVMIAKDKIYLIDIEDTEYDYDVFNILCWPIGIFQEGRKGECNRAFQKGLFEGFDLQRSNLDKQILFMYMAKFCFSVYSRYTRKQDLDFLMLHKIAYDKTNGYTKLEEGILEE